MDAIASIADRGVLPVIAIDDAEAALPVAEISFRTAAAARGGFNRTGGVSLDNLGDWLALPEVRAVGGTWIANRKDIAAGNWKTIARNAAKALARVREVPGR